MLFCFFLFGSASGAAAGYGVQDTNPSCRTKVPQLCPDLGPYPSYAETLQLALTNWARTDPQDYLARQLVDTFACPTTPRSPLTWSSELNQAARFQAYNLGQPGCTFGDQTCSKFCYLFDGSCQQSARLTSFATAANPTTENTAAGVESALRTTKNWLKSTSHCSKIFSDASTLAGAGYVKTSAGYKNYWVQTFGSGPSSEVISSASHLIDFPTEGKTTMFMTTTAQSADINTVAAIVNGVESLISGSTASLRTTYTHEIDTPTGPCQTYSFSVSVRNGTVYQYPKGTPLILYGTANCTEPAVAADPSSSNLVTPLQRVTGNSGIDISTANEVGVGVGLFLMVIAVAIGLFLGRHKLPKACLAEKIAACGGGKLRYYAAAFDFLSLVLFSAARGTSAWSSVVLTGTTLSLSVGPWNYCDANDQCSSLLDNCASDGCPGGGLIEGIQFFVGFAITFSLFSCICNALRPHLESKVPDKVYSAITYFPMYMMLTASVFGLFSVCLWAAYTNDVMGSESTTTSIESGLSVAGLAWLFPLFSALFVFVANSSAPSGSGATNV